MTNDNQQPTPTEIHAYELEARNLRAQAMRAGSKAAAAFVKSVAHRVAEAFARPVHA